MVTIDDPPVSIDDRDGAGSTYLWNVQQHRASYKGDVQTDAIYSRPSDEAFLVSLEKEEDFQINGRATGPRLSRHYAYSDDPLEALAEYAARLLAHINGNQGDGWTLSNDYTGRSIDCVMEEVTIIKRRSEKYEFDFSIRFRSGTSMMPYKSLDIRPTNPTTTTQIAGKDLGEVEEMMITKRQDLLTHAYVGTGRTAEDNEIEARSGAVQEVSLRGSIPGAEADRQTIDDAIRSRTGQQTISTLDLAFPGYSLDGMVKAHEPSREAGRTRVGQYELSFVEGTAGSTEGA